MILERDAPDLVRRPPAPPAPRCRRCRRLAAEVSQLRQKLRLIASLHDADNEAEVLLGDAHPQETTQVR